MRRMRTRLLLGAIACLVLAAPLAAQVAPTVTGETGLFQVDERRHRCRRGASLSGCPGACGTGPRRPFRYAARSRTILSATTCSGSAVSVGYGLLPSWEADRQHGLQPLQRVRLHLAGNRERALSFRRIHAHRDGQDPPRNEDPPQLEGSGPRRVLRRHLDSDPVRERRERDRHESHGLRLRPVVHYGWVTFQTAYLLNGDVGTPTPFPDAGPTGYDLSNTWTNAVGVAVPLMPHVFKIIGEINRVHYDGGDTQPPNFSEATLGGRFAFGDSGFSASGAVRVNIDRWAKYGSTPSNIGGLVQVAYAPRRPGAARGLAPPCPAKPSPRRRRSPCRRRPGSRSRARRRPPRPSRVTAPAARPADLDDRRDPLRRRQEPPHEHREGHPRRRRPPPEEQPRRHLHDLGLHRPEGEGRGPRRAREGPRRGGPGLPHEAARHRRLAHHDRGQGRRRLARRDAQPPRRRDRHVPLISSGSRPRRR